MAARITIMAGGTGGHVFPALAVAQELQSRGWEVNWLGTPDSFESRIVPQYGFPIDTIDSFRLRGQSVFSLVLAPMRLLRAIWQARQVLVQRKPSVVLGMGGFVTGPGGIASGLMSLPLVIHEQNAIPGMTNRWLAKVAKRVLQAFPNAFDRKIAGQEVGNPVRADIRSDAEKALNVDKPLNVLLIGGSLGALALNEALPAALALMPESARPNVLHQTGRGKLEATTAIYKDCAVKAECSEFIDDMAAAYQWADVMICRAGALTVSELAMAAMPAILVPFPHAVDDHQTINARFLSDRGAAVLMPQTELNAELLANQLSTFNDNREQLSVMAQKATELARPNACIDVANVCEEVAK